MPEISLRTFTEEEYHRFFRGYVPDPLMDSTPFTYSREQISRSYAYNHHGYRNDYEHFGVFLGNRPVGSFQLKRINPEQKRCEFGIILQNDAVKNRGIGSEAIRLGMRIAREKYRIEQIIGDTMGRNKPMIHVFEKLGFRLTERIPAAFQVAEGRYEDRLVYMKNLTEDEP